MTESGRSKGQRSTFIALLAVLSALIVVPVAAYAGSAIASSTQSTVLGAQSTVTSVELANGSAVAFSSSAGQYTWTMPAGQTTAFVVTGVTVDEMQAQSVNQVTLATNYAGPGTVDYGVGTSATSFLSYSSQSSSNLTSTSVGIPASSLTGGTSQYLILEIQSSAASYTASFTVRGNNGFTSWFGPAAAEDIGYIIGGLIVWTLAILTIPWYDLEIHRIARPIVRAIKREPRHGRRRGHAEED